MPPALENALPKPAPNAAPPRDNNALPAAVSKNPGVPLTPSIVLGADCTLDTLMLLSVMRDSAAFSKRLGTS